MTSVTVVIPAYNEGACFAAGLVSLTEYFAMHRGGGYEFRYLVVDDGSGDETYAVARSFANRRSNVRVFQHPTNRGLGAALRTAIAELDTDVAIVLDADLSYAPAVGMQLLEALESENADIAIASAYMRGGAVVDVPLLRRTLSREANRVLSLAACGRYATFTCMVRAYRVAALKQLDFSGSGMDAIAEMLLIALRKGMRIAEVPATLRWSEERRNAPGRFRPMRLAAQTWMTLRLAFAHRPALWFAVPGLFPGLLPLVVAALLILHVSTFDLAVGSAITVAVQYTSLAVFAGQLGTFFTRRLRQRSRSQSNRMNPNDYDFPKRIA
ncbi:MAG TPA: glycosyltransferase family 2 protein [Candidatus Baltobacteraceae bacterium]|jgi:glycosyltransferase involved in cell wall biosynthesis|nr:glycosyltransferase family 2 protein [Candidatus Baltobacteraceae bacterium]